MAGEVPRLGRRARCSAMLGRRRSSDASGPGTGVLLSLLPLSGKSPPSALSASEGRSWSGGTALCTPHSAERSRCSLGSSTPATRSVCSAESTPTATVCGSSSSSPAPAPASASRTRASSSSAKPSCTSTAGGASAVSVGGLPARESANASEVPAGRSNPCASMRAQKWDKSRCASAGGSCPCLPKCCRRRRTSHSYSLSSCTTSGASATARSSAGASRRACGSTAASSTR
mmetsp:Transcript_22039/g.55872  ORF Transcript_22039/g.55872 Transcript_22039/m.55872 type:complete len:231 (+) Transcript_22039:175-867(+)